MGAPLGFAENQAAVGAATAATLFSELGKLSGAAALSVPPVLMLASMGSTWSIHACLTRTVDGIEEYHIYPLATHLDLKNPIHLFHFQVVLSRIRDDALSVIKPWLKEQIARIVPRDTVDKTMVMETYGCKALPSTRLGHRTKALAGRFRVKSFRSDCHWTDGIDICTGSQAEGLDCECGTEEESGHSRFDGIGFCQMARGKARFPSRPEQIAPGGSAGCGERSSR